MLKPLPLGLSLTCSGPWKVLDLQQFSVHLYSACIPVCLPVNLKDARWYGQQCDLWMRKLRVKEVKEFACSPLAGKLQRGREPEHTWSGQKKELPLVLGIASSSFSSPETEMDFDSGSGKPSSLSALGASVGEMSRAHTGCDGI